MSLTKSLGGHVRICMIVIVAIFPRVRFARRHFLLLLSEVRVAWAESAECALVTCPRAYQSPPQAGESGSACTATESAGPLGPCVGRGHACGSPILHEYDRISYVLPRTIPVCSHHGKEPRRMFRRTMMLPLVVGLFRRPSPAGVSPGVRAITRPSADITLSFVQPGRIVQVPFSEGDRVRAGMMQPVKSSKMTTLPSLTTYCLSLRCNSRASRALVTISSRRRVKTPDRPQRRSLPRCLVKLDTIPPAWARPLQETEAFLIVQESQRDSSQLTTASLRSLHQP